MASQTQRPQVFYVMGATFAFWNYVVNLKFQFGRTLDTLLTITAQHLHASPCPIGRYALNIPKSGFRYKSPSVKGMLAPDVDGGIRIVKKELGDSMLFK
jgi:hypothetical protein